MLHERMGMSMGDQFEHFALKRPHPKVVLSEPERERALVDKVYRRELEDRLLGELRLSPDARIQSLKAAVVRYQSPEGIRDTEGHFLHPKTRFAEKLYKAFSERVAQLFPGLETKVVVCSAVGSLLDLHGIDGFVRVFLRDRRSGNIVGVSDVTLDLSSKIKEQGTRSNITAIGESRTLEDERILDKFVKDISDVGAQLLKVPLADRAKMTNINVIADDYTDYNRAMFDRNGN